MPGRYDANKVVKYEVHNEDTGESKSWLWPWTPNATIPPIGTRVTAYSTRDHLNNFVHEHAQFVLEGIVTGVTMELGTRGSSLHNLEHTEYITIHLAPIPRDDDG